MQHDTIRFHGSYRYADRDALERAIALARQELDDEDDADRAWLQCFVTNGTNLAVNLTVRSTSFERHAAANVFLILAHTAVEGAVEARMGDHRVDVFASGDED
jgi:hypothetical protein